MAKVRRRLISFSYCDKVMSSLIELVHGCRADVGIRPYRRAHGGAGDHKGRPYVLGPPGVPVGGDALIAPPHRLAAEAGARP